MKHRFDKIYKFSSVALLIFTIFISVYSCERYTQITAFDGVKLKLVESQKIDHWVFRFVKVDTSLDVVKVSKKFNISFIQKDTLMIPDTTGIIFPTGIKRFEHIALPDSSYFVDDTTIAINYQNNQFSRGFWYVTAKTKYKNIIQPSQWSKPVYFQIVLSYEDDKVKRDAPKNATD